MAAEAAGKLNQRLRRSGAASRRGVSRLPHSSEYEAQSKLHKARLVSVERYLPNSDASEESEGCAELPTGPRTS